MALIALLLLLPFAAIAADRQNPCAAPQTAADVRFTLALKAHSPVFQEGEIIPLELTFTSSTKKRYWADVRNYDRSGRLGIEYYCVEPGAPDPLDTFFQFGAIGGGLGSTQELSSTPFTADAELNEWRSLKAGHYRVFAISYRVWRPPDPREQTPYGRVSEVVRSNIIELDVKPADPAWQAEQLRTALHSLTTLSTLEEGRRASRKLRFLNTEESTRQLAKMFWGLNKQPIGWDLMLGLYGSPYRQLAIDSMRAELSVPDHAITDEFLSALVNLQITSDHAWDPPSNPAENPADDMQRFWDRRRAHMQDLMKSEVQAVIAALPKKIASARALTLSGLLMAGGADTAISDRIRPALIAAWNDLPVDVQRELIQLRWPLIAGPEMLPILRRRLAEPPPALHTMDAMARDEALKHLYELDHAAGRAAILRDLENVNAQPSLETIQLLQKEDVSGVLPGAVERISHQNARDLDYELVDLYADRDALSQIKAAFEQHQGNWACAPQSAMLRYFLRVDLEYGSTQVKAALQARKNTGCYRMLFHDLGASLPKAQQTAIEALQDPDPEVEIDAVRALGSWGTPEAEEALWARLRRFHTEWTGREDQLRSTSDFQKPGSRGVQLQQALVWAIAKGVNWICPPDKLGRLDALVLTKPQHQELEAWINQWKQEFIMINPAWFADGKPKFIFLQYDQLTEEQFGTKVAQLPRGMRLRWQFLQAGQVYPPVTMARQDAVYERVRAVAEQHGILLEKLNHP